ncbi:MAG: chromosome segregation protein SMC [Gammaproteobacteria bacterium]|nr:chromosome segregation protein SMC [Gammaproteobacteria bacterium]MCF6363440.1 chromosome segregation protein SMC [Gammaproteobacteria bacterium]
MRLSKIKLAGFKSFVDPTTIPLPSNLIGVVGPNGCGKSNVIDAVRWVMGESSAKNLRGDSMADVIFNGSTSRKPVGQATIELIFDNSDGTIKGEFATFNEISVRRTVSRDGQSQYYLNGTRCRRRDVTDIFLGTGLGPRSYSIIEQGMISRLIEARPEDLRVFLEEAAGISKYKERRRETEKRIRHTRDNMERLTDLRDELGKQLERLNRQAITAEKYKEFKGKERLLKGQLAALRWRALDQQVTVKEGLIREKELAVEASVMRQRAIESEIEKLREQNVEMGEIFSEVQGRFYSVGGDIARVEQSIQHTRERRLQQERDLAEAERALAESQAHQAEDREKIAELEQQLEILRPQLEEAKERQEISSAALVEAEQAMHEWQSAWAEFNQNAAEPARSADVERTRLQSLEQQHIQQEQRVLRLQEEKKHLLSSALKEEITQRQTQLEEYALQTEALQERLQNQLTAIAEARDGNHQLSMMLDEQRGRLQAMQGRYSSLEALQQAALGKTGGEVAQWLAGNGLADAERLAQGLTVDTDWERAVECVLGQHLEAVCVDGLDPVAGLLGGLEHGSLALFDTARGNVTASGGDLGSTLADKVTALWPLPMLAGVYTADDLQQALALRPQLAAHESVITRDGVWLGPNWLRVARDADEKAGVLHREQELKELTAAIEQLRAQVEEGQAQLAAGREDIQRREEEREAVQRELHQASRQQAEVQAQLSGRQARLEQMHNRSQNIERDISELRQQSDENEEETKLARGRLATAMEAMELLATRREELELQRESLRDRLDDSRDMARSDRDTAHELSLKVQTMSTELASVQQGLSRMEQQLEQVAARRELLSEALAESAAPIEELQEELARLLESRSSVEQELTEARRRVEAVDHALREHDQQRHTVERELQELRSGLEQARMAWQALQVRRQTLSEQLEESDYSLDELCEHMPEEAREDDWAQHVEQIAQRIQRLGPINLAAIEEYKTESERKEYLDAQHADLTEALDTLEGAIRKIDRETRTRFKETFERVNSGFKGMFPRLFGGGHAYLELTGDDLLDTGVTVMARPPGKRNSTIHLLSGGEKALTAVALVFAIFQLNPAPFCMLDEVDAPLDDANVGRFCAMVKEMSEHVQFIFITHNKITMELAHQLNGVTMHEPGVSRLVCVDVDEAAKMVG